MSNKSSLKRLAVMSIYGAFTSVASVGQSINLQANIPFAFTAGRAAMPAGRYQISANGLVVAIRQLDGRRTKEFVLTLDAAAPHDTSPGRLSFQQIGSRYFLSEIWDQAPTGREIPVPTR